MQDFFDAVQAARKEYLEDYRPELEKLVKERAETKDRQKKQQLDKIMSDMRLSKEGQNDDEHDSDLEPQYEGDGQILDPVSTICHDLVHCLSGPLGFRRR